MNYNSMKLLIVIPWCEKQSACKTKARRVGDHIMSLRLGVIQAAGTHLKVWTKWLLS